MKLRFNEYVDLHMQKVANTKVVEVPMVCQTEKPIEELIKDCNPNKWTARIVNSIKYLIYNNKYIDITEMKMELDELYNSQGYSNYGFSKLSESELIRYKKVRDIIIKEFFKGDEIKLSSGELAELLYKNEMKDFEWRPEQLVK